jgi:hypothetical protein
VEVSQRTAPEAICTVAPAGVSLGPTARVGAVAVGSRSTPDVSMVRVMSHQEVASQALTKALTFQSPLARKNLERLRRVHPDETPTELAKRVTRDYLSLVTTSGGAMGAAGAIPGGGLASAAFDLVAFTEASVLYTLTLAEIHGIHPEDIERRRLLVQTVLIGDSAITALSKGADKTVPYWGKQIVNAIPMSAVHKANKVLGPRFITKYGTKQGILVLSKQIPIGLGIGIGAFANHMIGRTIVATAKKVFGPAPEFFVPRPDPVVVGNLALAAALPE